MKLKEWWHRFREWQRTPYEPPALTCDQHVCINCGESFDGDYCPRCGQKGETKRLTFKNVMISALDVWGAGNHSMLRNIIHLMFRPGYMIRDYLNGHRQPYFPPFKMLFIFVAVFLIFVSSVRWSMGITPELSKMRQIDQAIEQNIDSIENRISEDVKKVAERTDKETKAKTELSFDENPLGESVVVQGTRKILLWIDNNRAVSILFIQMIVALSVWITFRRTPRMGTLSLSEQFFAQVFISSQILLFSFIYYVLSLLWVHGGEDDLPGDLMLLIYYLDYKQLFGFGWWKTFWRGLMTLLLVGLFFVLLAILFIFLIGVETGVRAAL